MLQKILDVLEVAGERGAYTGDIFNQIEGGKTSAGAFIGGLFELKSKGYVYRSLDGSRIRYYLTPKYYQRKRYKRNPL